MIYKQCMLTIANNTATLDEDIYLYRLDKNVELYFTIVNNKYKFDKSDLNNIINITNASFFQVRLYKDDQIKYTFAIQPTEKGQAILTITDQLIDEPIEVGDYDFQISLLDADKTSMISMPIVSKQLHVCEPLVDAVSNSTIDTAAIDTASVMMSDEGDLPVVDSTGKYIPTLWDTGDTISKAKINHIEKGILQAHIDALANKIPKVTPPKGNTTSDIVTLYNELPDDGLIYFTEGCMIQNTGLIGLCSIYSYTSDEKELSKNNTKSITCYYTGVYVDITSAGAVVETGLTNADLSSLMEVLRDPQRKTGQVFTMTSDNEYGWADIIPHIIPPKGHTTSDLVNLYNMLPESGFVYLTNTYTFPTEDMPPTIMIGLCTIMSNTTSEQKQVKGIGCYDTGLYANLTPDGNVVGHGMLNTTLDNVLNDPQRKTGQVLTMISNDAYGWRDVPNTIPQITPPKQSTTSDIVTLYNELPERGLVYFTDSYYISDALIIGLCYIDPYTDNNKPAKTIICTSTVMYVNITSTGDISGTGIANNDLDIFVTGVLKDPDRKKGQVLTMINNSEYGWADPTPQLCVHEITGDGEIQLTFDPYQLITLPTPVDLSSPSTTISILLPMIDESDTNVYKIHLLLMANSSIEYEFPTANYDRSLDNLTSGVMYEFIYTYVSPFWVCHGIEYSINHSSEPR